jgi:hypothetical protein
MELGHSSVMEHLPIKALGLIPRTYKKIRSRLISTWNFFNIFGQREIQVKTT